MIISICQPVQNYTILLMKQSTTWSKISEYHLNLTINDVDDATFFVDPVSYLEFYFAVGCGPSSHVVGDIGHALHAPRHHNILQKHNQMFT